MEGIIILLALSGLAFLLYMFYVSHKDSEGVIGFLANLVGFIYHKFWIILVVIILLAYFLFGPGSYQLFY